MNNNPNDVKQAFAERLHKAMDKNDYPKRGRARVLSQKFGISDKGAGKWLNGDAIPETSKIPMLANFLDVTTEWLLSGKHGSSSKNEDSQGNVIFTDKLLRRIPVLDFVQAGKFREVIYDGSNVLGYTYSDYEGCKPEDIFSVQISGNSMNPRFFENDNIVVDPNLIPQPGDYVVAENGDYEVTFKKYKVTGYDEYGRDIFELVPLNPDFGVLSSTKNNLRIIGVVVRYVQNLR